MSLPRVGIIPINRPHHGASPVNQPAGQRSGGAAPAAKDAPAPLPRHVIEALTADAREAAQRALSPEEREAITVTIEADELGRVVRIRGEAELVDRLERELFPDDRPDGQAPGGQEGGAAADREVRRSAAAADRRRYSAARTRAPIRSRSEGTAVNSTM